MFWRAWTRGDELTSSPEWLLRDLNPRFQIEGLAAYPFSRRSPWDVRDSNSHLRIEGPPVWPLAEHLSKKMVSRSLRRTVLRKVLCKLRPEIIFLTSKLRNLVSKCLGIHGQFALFEDIFVFSKNFSTPCQFHRKLFPSFQPATPWKKRVTSSNEGAGTEKDVFHFFCMPLWAIKLWLLEWK